MEIIRKTKKQVIYAAVLIKIKVKCITDTKIDIKKLIYVYSKPFMKYSYLYIHYCQIFSK